MTYERPGWAAREIRHFEQTEAPALSAYLRAVAGSPPSDERLLLPEDGYELADPKLVPRENGKR